MSIANFSEEPDLFYFENQLWNQQIGRVMGLDEVGRGCLAGPVVAAGVVFLPGTKLDGLDDSKRLSATERERLEPEIKEKAQFWIVQEASVEEINRLNILKASMLAMQRCVEMCKPGPEFLLVDGNYFPPNLIPFQTIVKGDSRSASIAAASILAKVYRDRLMTGLANDFPGYGWEENAGYATLKHRKAIGKLGTTLWHRSGFRVKPVE